jgi:hypothetical protein
MISGKPPVVNYVTVTLTLTLQLENCCGAVVMSCCCENLVAEAENRSGTQSKRKVNLWKPLSRNSY